MAEPGDQGKVERHLPVRATVRKAYAVALHNLDVAWRVTWLPLALMLPLVAAWNHFGPIDSLFDPPDGTQPTSAQVLWAFIVDSTIELPFLCSIGVSWHRFILLGERPQGRAVFRLDRAVWQYTAISWILTSGVTVILFWVYRLAQSSGALASPPLAVVFWIFFVVAILAAIYLTTVMAMLLPGTAVGSRLATIRSTLGRTKYNFIRLLIGMILSVLPAIALSILLGAVLPEGIAMTNTIASVLASAGNGLLVTPVAGFLTYAYMVFFPEEAPVGGPSRP